MNAKSHKGDVSDGFKSLMRYIMDGEAQDGIMCEMSEKRVAESREEGEEKKAKEVVMNLAGRGMPAESIAEYSENEYSCGEAVA